jgi:hypothetical protein
VIMEVLFVFPELNQVLLIEECIMALVWKNKCESKSSKCVKLAFMYCFSLEPRAVKC